MSSGEVRILFDECIPKPSFKRLVEFIAPEKLEGITVSHLCDLVRSGTLDEVWVPELKGKGWTVVSADGGRQPNKRRGKKLPDLCLEFGITLIVLSPTVHRRKSLDKARTIVSIWDQVVKIAADPSLKGRPYALEPLNSENPEVGRLVEKEPRKPPKRP